MTPKPSDSGDNTSPKPDQMERKTAKYHVPRPLLNLFPAHKGLYRSRIYFPWTPYTELRTSIIVASLQKFSQWTPKHSIRTFALPPTSYYNVPIHEKFASLPPIPINDHSGNYNYTPGSYMKALIKQEERLTNLSYCDGGVGGGVNGVLSSSQSNNNIGPQSPSHQSPFDANSVTISPHYLPHHYNYQNPFPSLNEANRDVNNNNNSQSQKQTPQLTAQLNLPPVVLQQRFVCYDLFTHGRTLGDPNTDRIPMRQILWGMHKGRGLIDPIELARGGIQAPTDFIAFQDEPEPRWVDWAAIKRGQNAYKRHLAILLLSLSSALFRGFSDRRLSDVLCLSGESLIPLKTFLRYQLTSYHLSHWLTGDLGDSQSTARRSLRQVRLLHTHARIRAKPYYEAEARKEALIRFRIEKALREEALRRPLDQDEILKLWSELEAESLDAIGCPLSQSDLTLVQMAFSTIALYIAEREYSKLFTTQEAHDICHLWRLLGYRLGIDDRFNICNSYITQATAMDEIVAMLAVYAVNPRSTAYDAQMISDLVKISIQDNFGKSQTDGDEALTISTNTPLHPFERYQNNITHFNSLTSSQSVHTIGYLGNGGKNRTRAPTAPDNYSRIVRSYSSQKRHQLLTNLHSTIQYYIDQTQTTSLKSGKQTQSVFIPLVTNPTAPSTYFQSRMVIYSMGAFLPWSPLNQIALERAQCREGASLVNVHFTPILNEDQLVSQRNNVGNTLFASGYRFLGCRCRLGNTSSNNPLTKTSSKNDSNVNFGFNNGWCLRCCTDYYPIICNFIDIGRLWSIICLTYHAYTMINGPLIESNDGFVTVTDYNQAVATGEMDSNYPITPHLHSKLSHDDIIKLGSSTVSEQWLEQSDDQFYDNSIINFHHNNSSNQSINSGSNPIHPPVTQARSTYQPIPYPPVLYTSGVAIPTRSYVPEATPTVSLHGDHNSVKLVKDFTQSQHFHATLHSSRDQTQLSNDNTLNTSTSTRMLKKSQIRYRFSPMELELVRVLGECGIFHPFYSMLSLELVDELPLAVRCHIFNQLHSITRPENGKRMDGKRGEEAPEDVSLNLSSSSETSTSNQSRLVPFGRVTNDALNLSQFDLKGENMLTSGVLFKTGVVLGLKFTSPPPNTPNSNWYPLVNGKLARIVAEQSEGIAELHAHLKLDSADPIQLQAKSNKGVPQCPFLNGGTTSPSNQQQPHAVPAHPAPPQISFVEQMKIDLEIQNDLESGMGLVAAPEQPDADCQASIDASGLKIDSSHSNSGATSEKVSEAQQSSPSTRLEVPPVSQLTTPSSCPFKQPDRSISHNPLQLSINKNQNDSATLDAFGQGIPINKLKQVFTPTTILSDFMIQPLYYNTIDTHQHEYNEFYHDYSYNVSVQPQTNHSGSPSPTRLSTYLATIPSSTIRRILHTLNITPPGETSYSWGEDLIFQTGIRDSYHTQLLSLTTAGEQFSTSSYDTKSIPIESLTVSQKAWLCSALERFSVPISPNLPTDHYVEQFTVPRSLLVLTPKHHQETEVNYNGTKRGAEGNGNILTPYLRGLSDTPVTKSDLFEFIRRPNQSFLRQIPTQTSGTYIWSLLLRLSRCPNTYFLHKFVVNDLLDWDIPELMEAKVRKMCQVSQTAALASHLVELIARNPRYSTMAYHQYRLATFLHPVLSQLFQKSTTLVTTPIEIATTLSKLVWGFVNQLSSFWKKLISRSPRSQTIGPAQEIQALYCDSNGDPFLGLDYDSFSEGLIPHHDHAHHFKSINDTGTEFHSDFSDIERLIDVLGRRGVGFDEPNKVADVAFNRLLSPPSHTPQPVVDTSGYDCPWTTYTAPREVVLNAFMTNFTKVNRNDNSSNNTANNPDSPQLADPNNSPSQALGSPSVSAYQRIVEELVNVSGVLALYNQELQAYIKYRTNSTSSLSFLSPLAAPSLTTNSVLSPYSASPLFSSRLGDSTTLTASASTGTVLIPTQTTANGSIVNESGSLLLSELNLSPLSNDYINPKKNHSDIATMDSLPQFSPTPSTPLTFSPSELTSNISTLRLNQGWESNRTAIPVRPYREVVSPLLEYRFDNPLGQTSYEAYFETVTDEMSRDTKSVLMDILFGINSNPSGKSFIHYDRNMDHRANHDPSRAIVNSSHKNQIEQNQSPIGSSTGQLTDNSCSGEDSPASSFFGRFWNLLGLGHSSPFQSLPSPLDLHRLPIVDTNSTTQLTSTLGMAEVENPSENSGQDQAFEDAQFNSGLPSSFAVIHPSHQPRCTALANLVVTTDPFSNLTGVVCGRKAHTATMVNALSYYCFHRVDNNGELLISPTNQPDSISILKPSMANVVPNSVGKGVLDDVGIPHYCDACEHLAQLQRQLIYNKSDPWGTSNPEEEEEEDRLSQSQFTLVPTDIGLTDVDFDPNTPHKLCGEDQHESLVEDVDGDGRFRTRPSGTNEFRLQLSNTNLYPPTAYPSVLLRTPEEFYNAVSYTPHHRFFSTSPIITNHDVDSIINTNQDNHSSPNQPRLHTFQSHAITLFTSVGQTMNDYVMGKQISSSILQPVLFGNELENNSHHVIVALNCLRQRIINERKFTSNGIYGDYNDPFDDNRKGENDILTLINNITYCLTRISFNHIPSPLYQTFQTYSTAKLTEEQLYSPLGWDLGNTLHLIPRLSPFSRLLKKRSRRAALHNAARSSQVLTMPSSISSFGKRETPINESQDVVAIRDQQADLTDFIVVDSNTDFETHAVAPNNIPSEPLSASTTTTTPQSHLSFTPATTDDGKVNDDTDANFDTTKFSFIRQESILLGPGSSLSRSFSVRPRSENVKLFQYNPKWTNLNDVTIFDIARDTSHAYKRESYLFSHEAPIVKPSPFGQKLDDIATYTKSLSPCNASDLITSSTQADNNQLPPLASRSSSHVPHLTQTNTLSPLQNQSSLIKPAPSLIELACGPFYHQYHEASFVGGEGCLINDSIDRFYRYHHYPELCVSPSSTQCSEQLPSSPVFGGHDIDDIDDIGSNSSPEPPTTPSPRPHPFDNTPLKTHSAVLAYSDGDWFISPSLQLSTTLCFDETLSPHNSMTIASEYYNIYAFYTLLAIQHRHQIYTKLGRILGSTASSSTQSQSLFNHPNCSSLTDSIQIPIGSDQPIQHNNEDQHSRQQSNLTHFPIALHLPTQLTRPHCGSQSLPFKTHDQYWKLFLASNLGRVMLLNSCTGHNLLTNKVPCGSKNTPLLQSQPQSETKNNTSQPQPPQFYPFPHSYGLLLRRSDITYSFTLFDYVEVDPIVAQSINHIYQALIDDVIPILSDRKTICSQ